FGDQRRRRYHHQSATQNSGRRRVSDSTRRKIRATASHTMATTRTTTGRGPRLRNALTAPTRASAIACAIAPPSASLAQRIRPEGLPGRGIEFAGEALGRSSQTGIGQRASLQSWVLWLLPKYPSIAENVALVTTKAR